MTKFDLRASRALIVGAAGVTMASFALAGCGGPTLAACDNTEIQAGLKAGINSSTHQSVTDMTGVTTVSKTPTGAVCKVHVKASSGAEADITYTLTLVGTNTNYLITKVDEKADPAAAAAAPAAPAGGDSAPAADAPADAAAPSGGDKKD